MNTTGIKNTIYKYLQGMFAVVLAAVMVVSCSDDVNFNGPENQKAQMNVNLTDAPANYQEVNIDVQGLRVHYTPSSEDTASSEGEWIELPVEPMKVDLLELTNGVDTLLTSAELEPGTYKELRLILGNENTVMVDSTVEDLKVPSGQESGYKIKFQTDLEAGEELDVTVDFDAARSVHKAGKSGKYILKPVLKAFVENGDEVETGSIAGVVEPTDADPFIYAIMDDDTAGSTQPDDDGGFLLEGLDAGQYDLSFEPTSDQYSDTTLTNITVEEDAQNDVGTVTLNES